MNTPEIITETVPVSSIVVHPDQPRITSDSLNGLTSSIAEIGLIEPLAVAWIPEQKGEGHYMVVSGHRRLAAMKELGFTEIPVHVITVEGEPANTIGALVGANSGRKDFTDAEKAMVSQRMLDLGMSAERIAAISAEDELTVTQRTGAFAILKAKQHEPEFVATLDFEQAMALAWAENHESELPDIVAEVLRTIESEPDQLDHLMQHLKDELDDLEKITQWMSAHPGIVVLENWPSYDGPYKRVADLEVTEHESCPGHCVHLQVGYVGDIRETAFCNDPKHYKHKSIATTSSGMDDAQREGRAFKKAMVSPTKVRREWIAEHLLSRDPLTLKSIFRFLNWCVAERAPARYPHEGVENIFKPVKPTSESKSLLAIVTAYCSGLDEELRLCQGPAHFRAKYAPTYLWFLKKNGYTISEHEAKLATITRRGGWDYKTSKQSPDILIGAFECEVTEEVDV